MNSQIKQQQNWLVTSSLSILALVAIAFVLHYTRDVLVPFVVAIFVGSLVSPLMDVMELRWKWRHSVSVGVALTVVMLATLLFVLVMLASIRTIVMNSQQYSMSFAAMSDYVDSKLQKVLPNDSDEEPDTNKVPDEDRTADETSSRIPVGSESAHPEGDQSDTQAKQETKAAKAPQESSGTKDSPMQQYFLSKVPMLVSWLLGQTATLFSGGTLTIIFVMFVLAGRNPNMVRQAVYRDIDSQVRSYISTKVSLSLGTGLLVWLSLALIELPMAPVFGVLAFLLNFIPSIGSIISTAIPIPFAIAKVFDPAEPLTVGAIVFVLAVICLPGAIQMLIGNVLEPKLMGNDLQLHPITILLALAIWGLLWGPIGMLLAVPMTAIIRIVLMKFEITQVAGKALAGELPDLDAVAGKANSAPDSSST